MTRHLLFDAGGTLVFPDPNIIAEEARAEGYEVTSQRLDEAYSHLIFEYDRQLRDTGDVDDWTLAKFFQAFLEEAGADTSTAERVGMALAARHEQRNLWTFTHPWVRDTLASLQERGYRMSVISNADGRVREQLIELGLSEFFEEIFDSHVVGIEKPDPRIFEHALERLDLSAKEGIYIGDVYAIDVAGANAAGIAAVLIDPLGLYEGWSCDRVTDVRHLPALLEAMD